MRTTPGLSAPYGNGPMRESRERRFRAALTSASTPSQPTRAAVAKAPIG